jgi:hypothetical protein
MTTFLCIFAGFYAACVVVVLAIGLTIGEDPNHSGP